MGRNKTHGMSKTRVYGIWNGMVDRCLRKWCRDYKYYGGRGITVCESWRKFERFYEDMGMPPTIEHSIDRIDNSKGYSKSNCRWATNEQQILNRGSCKTLEIDGVTKTITQWARDNGIDKKLAQARRRAGWSVLESVTLRPGAREVIARKYEALGTSLSVNGWSSVTGVCKHTINNRLRDGWPVEIAVSYDGTTTSELIKFVMDKSYIKILKSLAK